MRKLMTSLLILGLMTASCEKDETLPAYPFEVEVLRRSSDCGFYSIKILKGLSQVKTIAGSTSTDSTYIAKNLPIELESEGLKIMLDVRKTKDSELTACTTLGIGHPWLYVERAIKN